MAAKPSPAGRTAPRCDRCAHFANDPAAVEAAYGGFTAMGSGFASVRARDGFCRRHGLYLAAWDRCADFTPEVSRREPGTP